MTAGAIVAVAATFLLRDFVLFQLTLALTYAIAILGLNVLTGIGGQFSLGHSAFFALGAYTTATLMAHFGLPYPVAMVAAAIISLAAGYLLGRTASRLESVYLALATFALAVAAPSVLKVSAVEDWTGGTQGIVLDKPTVPFGLPITGDQWFYLLALCLFVLVFLAIRSVINSPTGRAMTAVRDNPIAAQALGIDLSRYRALAFALSALCAGLAGAFDAIIVGFVAPESFTVSFAIALFVGLVVGGIDSLPGALIGGLFVLFVPDIAESLSKGLAGAIYGLILLLLIYLMPSGAAGLGRLTFRKFSEKI